MHVIGVAVLHPLPSERTSAPFCWFFPHHPTVVNPFHNKPEFNPLLYLCRRTAETFMSKSKSFGGIPLTMTWHTGPFPIQQEPGTGPATVPKTVSRTIQRTAQDRHGGGSPSTAAPAARRSPSPSPEAQYPASLKLASAELDQGRYGDVGMWARHDDDSGEVGGPEWGVSQEEEEEDEGVRSWGGDEQAPGVGDMNSAMGC